MRLRRVWSQKNPASCNLAIATSWVGGWLVSWLVVLVAVAPVLLAPRGAGQDVGAIATQLVFLASLASVGEEDAIGIFQCLNWLEVVVLVGASYPVGLFWFFRGRRHI